MAKYRVTGQSEDLRQRNSVEINGVIKFAGEILDESDFKPASGNKYTDWVDGKEVELEELSELESLLKSGHVEEVKEN